MGHKVNYFPVQLRHDGVARRTLYRKRTKQTGKKCEWCGHVEYTTGHTTLPRLWHYYWIPDDMLRSMTYLTISPEVFCCLQCWEMYHGD